MSKYWESRSLHRELEAHLIAEKYLAKIAEATRTAQQEYISQINNFYASYANDNQMTMAEAKKYLTSKEVKEFNVDLERFREMSLSGNPAYDKLLDALSYRARISRYEALMARLEMETIALYGAPQGIQSYVYTGLMEVYQNSFYTMAYDFAVAAASYKPVAIITEDALKVVASYNWSGKEFSQRIWGHQAETVTKMRSVLEQSFKSGEAMHKTSKRIAEISNVPLHRAQALVRTESNFFHNQASLDGYEDADIDKYELLATLDTRTTPICQQMDGRVYPTSAYKVGSTAPPFHVNCRTTTMPYFEDERLRADETRESMHGMIDKMTYPEWKAKYLTPADELQAKKQKARRADQEQLKRYQAVFGHKGNFKSMNAFQTLKYENTDAWTKAKEQYRKRGKGNK